MEGDCQQQSQRGVPSTARGRVEEIAVGRDCEAFAARGRSQRQTRECILARFVVSGGVSGTGDSLLGTRGHDVGQRHNQLLTFDSACKC